MKITPDKVPLKKLDITDTFLHKDDVYFKTNEIGTTDAGTLGYPIDCVNLETGEVKEFNSRDEVRQIEGKFSFN